MVFNHVAVKVISVAGLQFSGISQSVSLRRSVVGCSVSLYSVVCVLPMMILTSICLIIVMPLFIAEANILLHLLYIATSVICHLTILCPSFRYIAGSLTKNIRTVFQLLIIYFHGPARYDVSEWIYWLQLLNFIYLSLHRI